VIVDVRLVNVSKVFGPSRAVDSLSLDVEKGSFLSLLGPSGCGKTTLLRMIAGFLQPTTGQIFIRGRSMTGVPPFLRNIGVVFQNYALFPHLDVFENVAFGLRLRKMARQLIKDAVSDVLRLVRLDGIEGIERRMPHELSGGQQQRVAIARALVIRPEVLLLDEPFGALDKKLREQMQLDLRALQRTVGITTVFVTHDQEEVLILSDRVALMRAGRIEHLGLPSEIYERPRTRFVADFMGRSNFFRGRVLDAGSKTILHTEDGLEITVPNGMKVGEAEILIRPERIAISCTSPANDAEIRFNGIVANLIYLGNHVKYEVRVGGRIIEVFEQNIGRQAKGPFQPGAKVVLSWRKMDAICPGSYPEDAQ
jgi:spermidine/putrescine ABC transporter ATP-binding subunit